MPEFRDEFGLALLLYGDLSQPDDLGLAVSPHARGGDDLTLPLLPDLAPRIKAQIAGTGSAYVTLQPSDLGLQTGGAGNGSFEVNAILGQSDGASTYLFDDPASTNLRVDRILAALGRSFEAAGVEGLQVSIDLGEDGPLSSVIPKPIETDAGDFLIGWRTGRGVYFEGGHDL